MTTPSPTHQEPQDTEAVWPTPWRDVGKAIIDANGTPVCFAVYGPHGPKMLAEIVAKVNAFPSLVAACESFQRFLGPMECPRGNRDPNCQCLACELRAALALAGKGEERG